MRLNIKPIIQVPKCSPNAFVVATAEEFNLAPEALYSKTRLHSISWPRQIAMALMVESGMSYIKVGKRMGLDPYSANHSHQLFIDRMSTDEKEFAQLPQHIERIIGRLNERMLACK